MIRLRVLQFLSQSFYGLFVLQSVKSTSLGFLLCRFLHIFCQLLVQVVPVKSSCLDSFASLLAACDFLLESVQADFCLLYPPPMSKLLMSRQLLDFSFLRDACILRIVEPRFVAAGGLGP